MRLFVTGFLLLSLWNTAARPETVCQSSGQTAEIPAKTLIEVETTEAVSSKTAKPGDVFTFRLAEPLQVGETLVLPIGTAGAGEVIHSAKAGWGGKAGELILAARYLQCGDLRIRVGHFTLGGSGHANFGKAFGASVIIPLAGLVIAGGDMVVETGTRAQATVSETTIVPLEKGVACMSKPSS